MQFLAGRGEILQSIGFAERGRGLAKFDSNNSREIKNATENVESRFSRETLADRLVGWYDACFSGCIQDHFRSCSVFHSYKGKGNVPTCPSHDCNRFAGCRIDCNRSRFRQPDPFCYRPSPTSKCWLLQAHHHPSPSPCVRAVAATLVSLSLRRGFGLTSEPSGETLVKIIAKRNLPFRSSRGDRRMATQSTRASRMNNHLTASRPLQ